jgi:hypothetical protein
VVSDSGKRFPYRQCTAGRAWLQEVRAADRVTITWQSRGNHVATVWRSRGDRVVAEMS